MGRKASASTFASLALALALGLGGAVLPAPAANAQQEIRDQESPYDEAELARRRAALDTLNPIIMKEAYLAEGEDPDVRMADITAWYMILDEVEFPTMVQRVRSAARNPRYRETMQKAAGLNGPAIIESEHDDDAEQYPLADKRRAMEALDLPLKPNSPSEARAFEDGTFGGANGISRGLPPSSRNIKIVPTDELDLPLKPNTPAENKAIREEIYGGSGALSRGVPKGSRNMKYTPPPGKGE